MARDNDFLVKIDSTIIDGRFGFQVMTNLIERHTGYDCVDIARVFIVASVSAVIVAIFDFFQYPLLLTIVSVLFIGLVITWLALVYFEESKLIRNCHKRNLPNRFRYSRRKIWLRLYFIIIVIFFLLLNVIRYGYFTIEMMDVFLVCVLLVQYFLACEKAPPHVDTVPQDA